MNTIDNGMVQRVAAGKGVKEILELITIVIEPLDETGKRHFWEKLRDVCLSGAPLESDQPKIKPMSERERLAFENQSIPFGRFEGRQVGDVSLGYLDALLGYKHEFIRQLERYMIHPDVKPRVQAAIEAERELMLDELAEDA